MAVTINASTSSGLVQTADTSGELNLQSNGTTKLSVLSTGVSGVITSGTAVASTSGTSIDFTSIPSWVKRITVMFSGVSTNGSSVILLQIGAGSVTTTGYLGTASINTSATLTASYTTGFGISQQVSATDIQHGTYVLTNLSGNSWVCNLSMADASRPATSQGGGSITLGGTLDRVCITTVNGTDAFDAGSINILYEG